MKPNSTTAVCGQSYQASLTIVTSVLGFHVTVCYVIIKNGYFKRILFYQREQDILRQQSGSGQQKILRMVLSVTVLGKEILTYK